jgi:methyl-accepting chemotaxis protein
MTKIGALSIRTKLIGVLSLFIIALVGLGLFDLHGIRTIHGLMGEVQQNWMPGVRWATALKTGVADARAAAFQHILASDEPGMDLAEKRFAEAVPAVAAARREVERRVTSEDERTIHSRFDASWASYQAALKEIFGYSRQYAKEAAGLYYNEKAAPFAKGAMSATDDAVALKTRGADAANTRADKAVGGTIRSFTFTLALTLLFGAFAAWALTRSISRGIASVAGPMRALAAGDLSAEIPHRVEETEIGVIADAVQVFKETLAEKRLLDAAAAREGQAKIERAQKLDAITRGFESSVARLTEALALSSNEMEATARSLAQTAEETNRQAVDVAASAEQTSSNVQTVAGATDELAASIREITRQIMESSHTASKAVQNVKHTDRTIQSLAEATQKIGNVVALISGVASQTNLLALNATIEAARAGDAGKGFAVVASEVKALANQTTAATNEIAAQIEHIQAASGSAVAAIREVDQIISAMNGTSLAVAAAMEEQGVATQEIARNVQHAAQGTRQVSGSIQTVKGRRARRARPPTTSSKRPATSPATRARSSASCRAF